MFYTWGQIYKCISCVQDIENISCEFEVFPVVPNKLGKVMKYEAKKKNVNHVFRDVKH